MTNFTYRFRFDFSFLFPLLLFWRWTTKDGHETAHTKSRGHHTTTSNGRRHVCCQDAREFSPLCIGTRFFFLKTYKMLPSCLWGVSLTHPVLAALCGEFILHVVVEALLIYVHRNRRFIKDGSPARPPHPASDFHTVSELRLSCTSRADFFFYVGSFSYALLLKCCFTSTETVGLLGTGAARSPAPRLSHSSWALPLTYTSRADFLCRKFHLHIPCWLFMWGVSRTQIIMSGVFLASRACCFKLCG